MFWNDNIIVPIFVGFMAFGSFISAQNACQENFDSCSAPFIRAIVFAVVAGLTCIPRPISDLVESEGINFDLIIFSVILSVRFATGYVALLNFGFAAIAAVKKLIREMSSIPNDDKEIDTHCEKQNPGSEEMNEE